MLVSAILAVIVSSGTGFLVYFFIKLCRDSRKRYAIVFVGGLNIPAKTGVSVVRTLINISFDLTDPTTVTGDKWIKAESTIIQTQPMKRAPSGRSLDSLHAKAATEATETRSYRNKAGTSWQRIGR